MLRSICLNSKKELIPIPDLLRSKEREPVSAGEASFVLASFPSASLKSRPFAKASFWLADLSKLSLFLAPSTDALLTISKQNHHGDHKRMLTLVRTPVGMSCLHAFMRVVLCQLCDDTVNVSAGLGLHWGRHSWSSKFIFPQNSLTTFFHTDGSLTTVKLHDIKPFC